MVEFILFILILLFAFVGLVACFGYFLYGNHDDDADEHSDI